MSGTIYEDLEAFRFSSQYFTGTLTREFVYDGFNGDEALRDPLVPVPGSTYQFDNKTLVCQGRGINAKYRDDAGRIVANYATGSTDGTIFKPFDLTYEKVPMRVPEFVRGTQVVPLPNTNPPRFVEGTKWFAQDVALVLQFPTLSITCRLFAPGSVSNQYHSQVIARAFAQVNHLHSLPLAGASPWSFNGGLDPLNPAPDGSLWVMQPPTFRQTSYQLAEIMYTWRMDPGNTGMGLPPELPKRQRVNSSGQRVVEPMRATDFMLAPPRPPWWQYSVIPAQGVDYGDNPEDARPAIMIRPWFPPQVPDPFNPARTVNNPYITLDGWRGLPGSPFS